ncbi:MAG: tetratricopeptide repeat protein [Pseudomonadota bacterium]
MPTRNSLRLFALSFCLSCGIAKAASLDELRSALSAGQLSEAQVILNELVALSPHDAELGLFSAELLLRQGNTALAKSELEQLHQTFPDWPEPLNNLAAIAYAQGDLDAARDLLEKALKTNRNYLTAHQNLVEIYSALAARSYAKALGETQSGSSVPALKTVTRTPRSIICATAPMDDAS